jgi:hypothetical protein
MKFLSPSLGASLAVGLLVIGPSFSKAEVVKELEMESDPSGAEVFLKVAGRETHIGTTPLTYRAEFHSEESILRFVFKKGGHKPVTLEVGAKQKVVLAKFESVQVTANPASLPDPSLREMQERLNLMLIQEVPRLLAAEQTLLPELLEPIRVTNMDGEPSLMIRMLVSDIKDVGSEKGTARQDAILKHLWSRLGKTLVLPIAEKLVTQRGIRQVVLQVRFNEQRFLFGVESHVETRTEMQCVPGYDYTTEYSSCAYRDANGSCVAGQQPTTVYNPCKSQVPVTKSEVKVSPQAQAAREQATASYVLPLTVLTKGATRDPDAMYGMIGVLLTDSHGKQLRREGSVPNSLLGTGIMPPAVKHPKNH